MRYLSTCFLAALFPLAAFAAPAAPAPDGALPAAPQLHLRTADGLPIAVEFVSFHQDVVKVRHPSTQRETTLAFSKLDKATQKILTEHTEIFCKKVVKANFSFFNFSAVLESNSRSRPADYAPQAGKVSLAVASKDAEGARTVAPGGNILRINAELPKEVPVDVPVEVKILWGLPPRPVSSSPSSSSSSSSKGSKHSSSSSTSQPSSQFSSQPPIQPETALLSITNVPGEYYSKPVGKFPVPGKSWAVIVYNKHTGEVLKTAGNTDIHKDYLTRNPPPK